MNEWRSLAKTMRSRKEPNHVLQLKTNVGLGTRKIFLRPPRTAPSYKGATIHHGGNVNLS